MNRRAAKIGGVLAAALALQGCADRVSGPDCIGLCDKTPPILVGFTGPADTLRFGSLNMSIGFPVSQLIGMRMDLDSVAYPELKRLDSLFTLGRPRERVLHMARTAAADSLQVIGLQEVMVYWKNGVLVSDFLEEFAAELEARTGKDYAVFQQRLNDSAFSAVWNGDSIGLEFVEGNAILVRADVQVLDTQRVLFQNNLYIPQLRFRSERGFTYARLKSPKGAALEVYNTHLEVFESYRLNQARELKQRILGERLEKHAQVVLGDLNAVPDTGAYNVIVKDASFFDPFRELPGSGFGTCCVAGSELWNPQAGFSGQRIDFVLAKDLLGAPMRKVTLDTLFVNGAGARQYASDHRFVLAGLSLPVHDP